MNSDREHWVEAEQWLNHVYPGYEWKAWHTGPSIFIHKHDSDNVLVAHTFQDKFREWVTRTDFQHAMNHLLHMHSLVHWKDRNWSEF